jgi:hypothetical protein
VVHRADRTLRKSVAVWLESGIVNRAQLEAIGWERLIECLQRFLDLKEDFDAARRSKFPWILNPVAWWQRGARGGAFSELQRGRVSALSTLAKSRAG